MWKGDQNKPKNPYMQTFRGGRNPKDELLGPAVLTFVLPQSFDLDHLKILYCPYFPLLYIFFCIQLGDLPPASPDLGLCLSLKKKIPNQKTLHKACHKIDV